MRVPEAGGKSFRRLFAFSGGGWVPVAAAAILLLGYGEYLIRPLWFDEALTLLNFAALPGPAAIYRSYVIPNNQILHTVILRFLWIDLGLPTIALRLFPLVCGGLTVWLLYRGFRRECGRLPLLAALGAWLVSPPFLLCATALRGYMLATLLVTAAWLCGRKFAVSGKFAAMLGWFGFALLALGVMPSALAGLAGAGLMMLPLFGKRFWKKPRFWLLAAAVPAAFALFYGPIWANLLKAFALKEGWHSAGAAALALGLALAATYNGLFLAAFPVGKRIRFRTFCYAAVWLLPLGMLLFPVAPFPRVWLVLFPLWAVLLAKGLRRRNLSRWWFVPALIAAVCSLIPVRETLSPWASLAGQDDFFAPYYLRREFAPYRTAVKLREMRPPTICASLSADPWSLLAVGTNVVFDGPGGRIEALPDGAAVVLRKDESPNDVTARFGGEMIRSGDAGYHVIYRWRKR